MQLTTRSYGLGCFWHSLITRWSSVALCVTMFAFVAFIIVREHGGRFLSSGMSLWRMRRPCAYGVFALYLKLCQRGVAWRGIPVAKCFSCFNSLPPLSFLFIYLVIYSLGGWFILLPLGFWPQCDGCYSGGWARGGLMAGLWVGRPVGALSPWGVLRLQLPGPWAPNLHLRRRR